MLKVSIIVPIYNTEKYLERSLDSIVAQSFTNLEIILVNDGSTDNSLEIIKRYADKDKRIKVIDQENKGVSEGRNIALKNATGDYLAFVDPDDWIDLDDIEKMVAFEEKKESDISFFNYKINGVIQKNNKIENEYNENNINNFIKLLINGDIPGYLWRLLLRKNITKNINFKKDLKIAEDLVFILEILKNTKKISKSEEAYYNYFLEENSLTRAKNKYAINMHNTFTMNKYIKELYSEFEIIANTKHISEIGLYILKMHRDGYNKEKLKEEFNFLVNSQEYQNMKTKINYNELSKIDKNIIKYIEKNNYNDMVKYFERLIKKSVFEYKINRIKNRLRGVKNES